MIDVDKLQSLGVNVTPRVLRNLRIAEVSLVDKGAGRGVDIVLAKRATEQKEPAMGPLELTYAVSKQFKDIAAAVKHDHPAWSPDKCAEEACKTEAGKHTLAISERLNKWANSRTTVFDKMNADGSSLAPKETGPVYYPPMVNEDHSGANQRSLSNLLPSQADAHQAMADHEADIAKLTATGMTRYKAEKKVLESDANKDRWAKAMQARGISPMNLPNSDIAPGSVHVKH